MYSREQRQKAIDTFIRLKHSYEATVRELGYPSVSCLRNWWRDFGEAGAVGERKARDRTRYSPEQKARAVTHYLECGKKSIYLTMDELGYPSDYKTLAHWIDELAPGEREVRKRKSRRDPAPMGVRIAAVAALEAGDGSAEEIARCFDVSRSSIYNWRLALNDHNGGVPKEKGRPVRDTFDELPDDIDELKAELGKLKGETSELRSEASELRSEVDDLMRLREKLMLEIDVYRATREVVKKGAGTDPKRLSNPEKARVINALVGRWKKKDLYVALSICKGSYYYAKAALERAEAKRRAEARAAVIASFEASGATYGYRRVYADVNAGRPPEDRIGEWTVRAIMREEHLQARMPRRRRRYSSYAGEITEAPPNLLRDEEGHHHFRAKRPNEVWVTDITEFSIPAGKVYLSPIIDCFDGCPIAWSQSRRPDAELANSSLRAACAQLREGEHPAIHSDRGSHYRWAEWIAICGQKGLIRSMSRKGCSPDNARAEGFFGRLKVEFFYARDWQGVSLEEFEGMLDAYLTWYRDERRKSDLGYVSPMQYRRDLELIA